MKIIKTILKILVFILVFITLFRGIVFRSLVSYSKTGERKNIEITNERLITEIEKEIGDEEIPILEIIEIANEITNKKLRFSINSSSSNPNVVLKSGKANCIGYAALFNSIGDYLIEKRNLSGKYQINHVVGKLEVFGFDIHKFFKNPFFKNHDFIEIKNLKNGTRVYIDPSLSDYLKILRVSGDF